MAVLHWLGQEFRVQCRAERKAPDVAGRCRPGGPRPLAREWRAAAGPQLWRGEGQPAEPKCGGRQDPTHTLRARRGGQQVMIGSTPPALPSCHGGPHRRRGEAVEGQGPGRAAAEAGWPDTWDGEHQW